MIHNAISVYNMKLHEILESTEQLDEGWLRNVAAAGAIVLAAAPFMHKDKVVPADHRSSVGIVQQQDPSAKIDLYVAKAAGKYKVDPVVVKAAVQAAIKHEYADFPRAKDILAVIGTESSFKVNSKSKLKKDAAIGLMQIRPVTTGIGMDALKTIDGQVKSGAELLHYYYTKTGSKDAALHAYNVGLTNHRTGKVVNPRYAPKVNQERKLYDDL